VYGESAIRRSRRIARDFHSFRPASREKLVRGKKSRAKIASYGLSVVGLGYSLLDLWLYGVGVMRDVFTWWLQLDIM
jgi:hypothetical protein